MKEENLNIDWHVKRMVINRLNNRKHKNLYTVAESLGITLRTLHNYKDRYNLYYNRRKGSWEEYSNKIVIIS